MKKLARRIFRELWGSRCEICGAPAMQDNVICGVCERQRNLGPRRKVIMEVTI